MTLQERSYAWEVGGDTAKLNLDRGLIIVDKEDLPLVVRKPWSISFISGKPYAFTHINQKTITLHKVLIQDSTGKEVDHIDRNPLNNVRSNLRLCSRTQNQQNRGVFKNNKCGYKGVYFDSRKQRWRARITVNKRRISLGSYESKEEAAKAYDAAAITHFKEFAAPNFAA